MGSEHASRVFARACRDLVVAIAAHENFAVNLEAFARRRASHYAPHGTIPEPQITSTTADAPAAPVTPKEPAAPTEEMYWPLVATALAPIAPPEAMPMAGLIASGATLEGGARGLRGLFTSTPSDKERKRVVRIAALAARVMEIVAGADELLSEDERRAIAMAIASFGLTPEEHSEVRPTGAIGPGELVIFGDLDARVRREIIRGAWQLAMRTELRAKEEEAVRAVAAKLDASPECEELRGECVSQNESLGKMAALAVELARGVALELPEDSSGPALEHLVRAAAPTSIAQELRARITSRAAPEYARTPAMDKPRRVQAVALAWATLVSADPRYSIGLHLRGALAAAASEAGSGYEVAEALDEVDRYLHQRVRDAALRGGA